MKVNQKLESFMENYSGIEDKNLKYLFYKKLVLSTMKEVNASKWWFAKIKNLWDRMNIDKPLGGYATYKHEINKKGND